MAHLTSFLRCAAKTTTSSAKPILQQTSGALAFKTQIRLLSSSKQEACFLNLDGGRKIAYRKIEPSDPRKPTVVFVPGFMSTMEGFKAKMLDTLCKKQGVGYIRFDFEGMGLSPGSFETVLFSHWYEDVRSILEKLVPNKALPGAIEYWTLIPTARLNTKWYYSMARGLLVGSSMGGWFSLKLAMDMPEKVAALILVAPAINFVTYYYDMLYKLVDQKEKDMLDSGKLVILKKNYGNIFLRKEFSDDSVGHHLDLKKPLNINVPVRILHGVQDPDVPYKQSLQIMSALTSLDVDVTFRKEGKHQMSEPADLQLLEQAVVNMLSLLNKTAKL